MGQTVRFETGPSSKAHSQGALSRFIQEINVLSDSLGLPDEVMTRAAAIVTQAAAMRFCRVTTRPVLAASALYVACRECRVPLTLREVSEATGTEQRAVGRCYATILERMHITRPGLNGNNYVHHLSLKTPLSEETNKESEDVIREAISAGLDGRNPMTLAAAALYLASCSNGEKVTQSEVAEAAGVGEESVRECCKAIRAFVVFKRAYSAAGVSLNQEPTR